ncbi:hypothetical protein PHIN9_03120 [Polynucleobacter sp. HIN9]|uniref:hypothetical protein n=1 Tax=Polynucleobacter sp. HIN9 TaxID=3047868 RepID=UPI00257413DB|nr:hypothetical protein [Polynucleobacter sp. HIN9]BEI40381.1 hypothetical protein PHIN9_03120 [Polynucleobacter sp. HIN9]
MSTNTLAVLVLSCDKYADLWPPFFNQFKKYFPVDDFKIYVGSNSYPCNEPNVKPILSGVDIDWSTSLKKILAQINEPKIFIILEDIFLSSPVDRSLLQIASVLLNDNKVLHVKYFANPIPDKPCVMSGVGMYLRGAPYRATVCGFWDREYLMELLIEGESPWDFEIFGSYRTSYSDGFYGFMKPICSYVNMVEKGCWIPKSLAWADSEGLDLDLTKRPMLNAINGLLSKLKMVYFDSVIKIPWAWRISLMGKLRRLLITY